MTEKAATTLARTVLQQCLHARLQVKPADEESEAEWVEVGLNMDSFKIKNNNLQATKKSLNADYICSNQ